MTKQTRPLLKLSASLLNSWQYQFQCDERYAEQAQQDFIDYINRVKKEPNIYMKRGIDFEQSCYDGNIARISNIIKNGAFQVYAEKKIRVGDYDVMLLGYLDVLKEGVIYDIKRVNKYELQKYYDSFQHPMYLELVPEAKGFVYLVAAGYKDDSLELYKEIYSREDVKDRDMTTIASTFFDYLKEQDLFEAYKENFRYGGGKKKERK